MNYSNFFNKIHNILRNGEAALTGMSALNEINNFILLIFIELQVNELFGDNSEDKKFSYLIKEYIDIKQNEINLEGLQEDYQKIIVAYVKNEDLGKYISTDASKLSVFVGIKQEEDDGALYNGYCQQLYDILKECRDFFFEDNNLTDEYIQKVFENIDYDILGDAYEKFKEDEVGNQGKKVGQYFTPRTIIKFCVERHIKPKYNEKCYDSSCGTGGFIHYLNKFVHDNEQNKSNQIEFKKNIYGNDKTADVIKPLNINMLLHNISIDNIKKQNSLSKSNCEKYLEFFKVCVGNPPFGVKNKIKYDDFKNFKNTEYNYWPKFMKSGKELVKDSMGQFLIHVINSLQVGGRFSLITDRGILNNGTENKSWQKQLRKWVLSNCDITEIILLPKGIFTSTNFDTAVITGVKKVSFIDMNSKKNDISTKNVKLFIGDFVDPSNKKGLLVKDEPDLVISINDIIEKDWSLKYDDYVVQEEVNYNGIEYKSLGEVCEFKYGTRITKSKNQVKEDYEGIKYPVYGGGGITFYTNDFNCNENTLIIGRFGVSPKCVRLVKDKFWLHDNGLYIDKNINININYFNYYLLINQANIFEHYTNHNAQAKLETQKLFREFKIPILSQEHQERIVNFMDESLNNDYHKLDLLVSEFKDIDLFKFLIIEDYHTLGLALEYIDKLEKFKTDTIKFNNLRKQCCFKTVKAEEKSLGEVCEFKYGTRITKSKNEVKGDYEGIKYPVYGGGGITFYTNDFNCNENTLIIGRFGVSPKCVRLVKDKFFLNDSGLFVKEYKNINKHFLDYFLIINQNEIFKYASGQAQKNMETLKLFRELKIPVPSLEDQQKVIDMIEAIDEEDSKYNQMLSSIKDMIQTVYDSIELITDTNQSNQVEEKELISEDEEIINSEDEENIDSEDEETQNIIEYKGKNYILEDNIVFKIKNDNEKGKRFGIFKDGKVKKDKKPKSNNVSI